MADVIADVPAGLIKLRDGRTVPRRSGWLEPGERLVCPFGHHVRPALDLHEGAMTVQCMSRRGAETRDRPLDGIGEPRCGALLYVATGAMGRFWADITPDEDARIKKLGIKPTGVARFLGIHFPR